MRSRLAPATGARGCRPPFRPGGERPRVRLLAASLLALAVAGCGRQAAHGGAAARAADRARLARRAPVPHRAAAPSPPASASGGTLPVPVAVVVDNAPGAWPQSGVNRAAVVWELLAEGGITRLFCIFTQPASIIGPVRSTRIYFDQLDRAYGLPLAHAGGNVDALAAVASWHLENLDEIYGAGPYFWRSSARLAPHNLYTSTALLEDGARAFGYAGRPLTLPATGPMPPGAQATSGVTLTYADDPPVYVYTAGWTWHGDAWERVVDGAVQRMADGSAVQAGTVFVLVVPYAPDPDPYTPGAIQMLWSQGGVAWVLRQGRRVQGTWSLGADGLPAVQAGADAAVAGPGPYWYEVVPVASDVSFQ